MMSRAYALVLIWVVLCLQPEAAWSSIQLGLHGEGGWVHTKAKGTEELDRSGSVTGLGGGFMLTQPQDRAFIAVLGLRAFDLEGESNRRQQALQTFAGMLRLHYRWIFGSWEAGILLNIDQGPGTTLRIADQDKMQSVISIGPELAYQWQLDSQSVVGFLSSTLDMGVPEQDNIMVFAGLQYWFPALTVTQATPEPPQAPAMDEPQPAPLNPEPEIPAAAPPPVITALRFKPDVFQFEKGSAQLTAASQSKAKALAEALKPFLGSWSHIDVEGHTDARGDAARNLKLSQDRAQSIKDFLVAQGFPADDFSAQGFGAEKPLSQLSREDPAKRRVELRFHDLKNAEALAESLQEFVVVEQEEKP